MNRPDPSWPILPEPFGRAVSAAPIGLGVVSRGLRYVWSNESLRRFEALLAAAGGEPPSAAGSAPGGALVAILERVFATGQAVVGEQVVLGEGEGAEPERESRYWRIDCHPVSAGEGGAVSEAALYVLDVSGEMRSERSLRESRFFFEQAQAIARIGSWASRYGRHASLFWSKELFDIFGVEPMRFVPRVETFYRLVHPEDVEAVRAASLKARQSGAPYEIVHRIIRPADGEVRWLHQRAEVFRGAEPDDLRLIGVVWDITESRRVEEERRRLLVRLDSAIRVRDEFIMLASHELRTPLTPLKLMTRALQRLLNGGRSPSEIPPERLSKLLDQVDSGVERLSRLADNLVEIARLRGDPEARRDEPVSLAAVASRARESLLSTLRSRSVEMTIEGDGQAEVAGDPGQLERMVGHLMRNALDFGRGRPVRVEIGRKGARAWISVRDEGIGIPAELQGRIFEAFERGGSVSHVGGMGLGLFLSRMIAELHGGEIRVLSEVGKGSTFLVSLPGLQSGRARSAVSGARSARPAPRR